MSYAQSAHSRPVMCLESLLALGEAQAGFLRAGNSLLPFGDQVSVPSVNLISSCATYPEKQHVHLIFYSLKISYMYIS